MAQKLPGPDTPGPCSLNPALLVPPDESSGKRDAPQGSSWSLRRRRVKTPTDSLVGKP